MLVSATLTTTLKTNLVELLKRFYYSQNVTPVNTYLRSTGMEQFVDFSLECCRSQAHLSQLVSKNQVFVCREKAVVKMKFSLICSVEGPSPKDGSVNE